MLGVTCRFIAGLEAEPVEAAGRGARRREAGKQVGDVEERSPSPEEEAPAEDCPAPLTGGERAPASQSRSVVQEHELTAGMLTHAPTPRSFRAVSTARSEGEEGSGSGQGDKERVRDKSRERESGREREKEEMEATVERREGREDMRKGPWRDGGHSHGKAPDWRGRGVSDNEREKRMDRGRDRSRGGNWERDNRNRDRARLCGREREREREWERGRERIRQDHPSRMRLGEERRQGEEGRRERGRDEGDRDESDQVGARPGRALTFRKQGGLQDVVVAGDDDVEGNKASKAGEGVVEAGRRTTADKAYAREGVSAGNKATPSDRHEGERRTGDSLPRRDGRITREESNPRMGRPESNARVSREGNNDARSPSISARSPRSQSDKPRHQLSETPPWKREGSKGGGYARGREDGSRRERGNGRGGGGREEGGNRREGGDRRECGEKRGRDGWTRQ